MRDNANELTEPLVKDQQKRLSPHQTATRQHYRNTSANNVFNSSSKDPAEGKLLSTRISMRGTTKNPKEELPIFQFRKELRPPTRHWNRIKSSSVDMIGCSFPDTTLEHKKIPIIFNSYRARRIAGTRQVPNRKKQDVLRESYLQNREKSRYSQTRVLKSLTTSLGEDFINLFS